MIGLLVRSAAGAFDGWHRRISARNERGVR